MTELDAARVHRLESLGERLAELPVDREAIRDPQQFLIELAKPVLGDGGLNARTARPVELAGTGRGRVGVLAGLDLLPQLVVRGLERLLTPVIALPDLVRGSDP